MAKTSRFIFKSRPLDDLGQRRSLIGQCQAGTLYLVFFHQLTKTINPLSQLCAVASAQERCSAKATAVMSSISPIASRIVTHTPGDIAFLKPRSRSIHVPASDNACRCATRLASGGGRVISWVGRKGPILHGKRQIGPTEVTQASHMGGSAWLKSIREKKGWASKSLIWLCRFPPAFRVQNGSETRDIIPGRREIQNHPLPLLQRLQRKPAPQSPYWEAIIKACPQSFGKDQGTCNHTQRERFGVAPVDSRPQATDKRRKHSGTRNQTDEKRPSSSGRFQVFRGRCPFPPAIARANSPP